MKENQEVVNELDNDPKYLKSLLKAHQRQYAGAEARKVRIESLLKRDSSKKWDASKKEKMLRRLEIARQDHEYSNVVLQQLKSQLEKLGLSADE